MTTTPHTPGRLHVRANGEANSFALLDDSGDWLLAIQHNGRQLVAAQNCHPNAVQTLICEALEAIDSIASQGAPQPVQQWSSGFDAWWALNRVKTHQIKSAQGFARHAYHAGFIATASSNAR